MASKSLIWPGPEVTVVAVLVALRTDRLSEAPVLWASLHVERLDLCWEAAQQNGLVDGVSHQPLWGFRDVLRQGEQAEGMMQTTGLQG